MHKTVVPKVAGNASTNISETIYRTGLRIGEVIYKCVSYNIPSFWRISLKGFVLFCFVFVLRDRENELLKSHGKASTNQTFFVGELHEIQRSPFAQHDTSNLG